MLTPLLARSFCGENPIPEREEKVVVGFGELVVQLMATLDVAEQSVAGK